MSSNDFNAVDCKVSVRKYILVSQPSRWRKRGDRVVVQSPMIPISKTISHVPVRRFNGKERNTVCYLPRQDFEKDSNNIYEREQVSKAISSTNAHAVALFDNSPSTAFGYHRGDRFWIFDNGQNLAAKEMIPVINLNTYQSGTIGIDQACWFPMIQGPKQELWTLGGQNRDQKLEGSNRNRYWSWGICQYLDRSIPITGVVEVPARDSEMVDWRVLSSLEARRLFEKRLRLMTEGLVDIKILSEEDDSHSAKSRASLLITPPTSPPVQILNKEVPKSVMSMGEAHAKPTNVDALKAFKNIFSWIKPADPTRPYVLRNSPVGQNLLCLCPDDGGRQCTYDSEVIHGGVPPPLRRRAGSFPSLTTEAVTDNNKHKDDLDYSKSLTVKFAEVPPRDFALLCPDLVNLNGSDLNASLVLLLMRSTVDRKHAPAFSVTSSPFPTRMTEISRASLSQRTTPNPLLANLCDLDNENCPYILLATIKHYHPPPEKCTISHSSQKRSSVPAGGQGLEQASQMHEHCITRLRPLPAGAGGCLLRNKPSREHTCCVWNEADMQGFPLVCKRSHQKQEDEDAKRLKQEIGETKDVSHLVGKAYYPLEEVKDLGEGGKCLMNGLEEGGWDYEFDASATSAPAEESVEWDDDFKLWFE